MRLTDAELIRLLAALLSLLLASQVMGGLFQRLHQPRVIGEIMGGVVLGPMVLGVAWPAAHAFLFLPEAAAQKPLAFAIWLGLLLLMFASGQESHEIHAGGEWKTIAWLAGLGILLPLSAGWLAASMLDLSRFYGPAATATSFGIIVALATAITAIPVIAKILLDLGLAASAFARVVLAVAFVEDVFLWVILSLVLGLGHAAERNPTDLALSVVLTVLFFAGAMAVGHRLYDAVAASAWWPLGTAHPATGPVLVLLIVVLTAYMLGVNPIFGGFLAGRIVANAAAIAPATRDQLRGLAFGLFIPVFFAGVGLRFDLRGGFDVAALVAFMAFTVGVKIVATLVAGRLAGQGLRPSFHLAIALNARGAMGVVLATIAFDAQLIAASFYAILVVVALLTSQFAGWWLFRVKRDRPEELELTAAVRGGTPPTPQPGGAGKGI